MSRSFDLHTSIHIYTVSEECNWQRKVLKIQIFTDMGNLEWIFINLNLPSVSNENNFWWYTSWSEVIQYRRDGGKCLTFGLVPKHFSCVIISVQAYTFKMLFISYILIVKCHEQELWSNQWDITNPSITPQITKVRTVQDTELPTLPQIKKI